MTTHAAVACCFDIGDDMASLVLRHVHDVGDRLSLACVSRTWRPVVLGHPHRKAGCWQALFDELRVVGPLAARLTDARFESC